jgi:hypothetical protein
MKTNYENPEADIQLNVELQKAFLQHQPNT